MIASFATLNIIGAQIIVLHEGQIAERGTHEELLQLEGQYASMWNMQLHQSKAKLSTAAANAAPAAEIDSVNGVLPTVQEQEFANSL